MTLFKDSETFVKERPRKITEKQHNDLLHKLAKEVITNNWSSSNISDIVTDLNDLSLTDNGFEMAKCLESIVSMANYNMDAAFVSWLDDFSWQIHAQLTENVKMWVKAHSIKPKFKKGFELKINKRLSTYSKFLEGDIIFINTINEEHAKYGISHTKNDKRNTIFAYEVIEENCNPI